MKRHKHKQPHKSVDMKSKPSTSKGSINRHIIAEGNTSKREYSLHSTKGYRSRTLVQP